MAVPTMSMVGFNDVTVFVLVFDPHCRG